MLKRPKAIFFDLDDTIMSFNGASEIAWKCCCSDFVKNNNVNFTSAEMLEEVAKTREWYWGDPVRHKIGRSDLLKARREVFAYALEKFGITDEKKIYEAAKSYSRIQEENWKLFDGVPDALETLRKSGFAMSIITNGISEIQNGKLTRFGIRDYFSHVICESDAGFSKPDAEIFELALNKLSLAPQDVLMIGDNLVWDVFGAQKLGIFAVWNNYEKKELPQDAGIKPDLTVNCVPELVKWLLSNTE